MCGGAGSEHQARGCLEDAQGSQKPKDASTVCFEHTENVATAAVLVDAAEKILMFCALDELIMQSHRDVRIQLQHCEAKCSLEPDRVTQIVRSSGPFSVRSRLRYTLATNTHSRTHTHTPAHEDLHAT